MKHLLICLSIFLCVNAPAQTQALQQLQLNIEKLAQLKLMLYNMQSSYSILSQGYASIKNSSFENLTLHKGFINSLSAVSPTVRNASAVNDILRTQAAIVNEYNTTFKKVTADKLFTPSEIRELTNAYANILSQSSRNLDAMRQVITPNVLQMSEAERLEILATLATDMEKQLSLLRTFTKQAETISIFRKRSKRESDFLRNQFGVAK